MKYIHCLWIHDFQDDPVILVSELDNDGHEIRKVEIWRSGQICWASEKSSSGDTKLSTYPLTSIDLYNVSKQFSAVEITKEEFENHWKLATSSKES